MQIKNYEGQYEISDDGRVFSCERKLKSKNRWGKMIKILKRKELKYTLSQRS